MISEIDIADWDRSNPLKDKMRYKMTPTIFRQDTIALLNDQTMDEQSMLDALIYNCVMYKEKLNRADADFLAEIGNVGLTD
jgi:hypothetical protein